jgi:trans-aconitate methyltransferase
MDLTEQKKIDAPDFKRHPWELVRLNILFSFLEKIPSRNFIMDVGSGDAFVAAQLSERYRHSKVAAIDIHYNDAFINENRRPNLLLAKTIKDFNSPETVDIVLLMDVLEHIKEPEELLHQIKQLKSISQATQFIITVPAFQMLFTQHDVLLGHYKRYTRKQLTELLRKQGFEIKRSGYFFMSLLMARALQKIFKTRFKKGLHNWQGNSFRTRVIVALLWIDFKISWYLSNLGINLPGLSCYCLCHPLPS